MTPPCKVIRCSSCLFSKQMCQTNAAAAIMAFYSLIRYCCTCIALRVLRYASQFVTLLAAHTAFVTAALCVLHATSFISSFVPLHSTRSQLTHLQQGRASLFAGLNTSHKGMHQPFRKQALQYSLGSISLHYVIHSLQ